MIDLPDFTQRASLATAFGLLIRFEREAKAGSRSSRMIEVSCADEAGFRCRCTKVWLTQAHAKHLPNHGRHSK